MRCNIFRPSSIEIEFFNEEGAKKTEVFEGEMSRLVQQNIDLLKGIPIIHWRRSFGFIKCTDSSFAIVSDLIEFYKNRIFDELMKDTECNYQQQSSIDDLHKILKARSAIVEELHFSSQMLIDFERAIRKELRNRL